jgi:hypothetical protein
MRGGPFSAKAGREQLQKILADSIGMKRAAFLWRQPRRYLPSVGMR